MEDKPLLNNSETKRPIILYVIIGVLLVAVIVLAVLLGTKKCNCETQCPECPSCPDCPKCPVDDPHYNESHFIPITGRVFTNRTEGSSVLQGKINHFDSKYFKMIDVYNMESNENRTILPKFKTYQQTSELSGHCAAIIMALNYLGETSLTERQCQIDLGIPDPDTHDPDDYEYQKYADISYIRDEIQKFGFKTTSNNNFTEENFPYEDALGFSKWAQEIIKKGDVILVNWADWGGTTSVVVGIDNLGITETPYEHVIILGDTYDTCDHLTDGFTIMSLEKFYYNWQSNKVPYLSEGTGQFLVVHKKDAN